MIGIKRIYGFILCCVLVLETKAQFEASYSTYQLNPIVLNPAFAGSEEVLYASAVDRRQWTLLEGAPSSQIFSIHSPIKKGNRVVGGIFQRDKIGVTSKISLTAIYGNRIQLREHQRLTLTLQGGFTNMVSRLSELDTRLPNDPVMNEDRVEFFTPVLGSGILWNSKSMYAGISSPDLWEPNLRNKQFATVNYRNFYFQYGIIVKSIRELKWIPSLVVKYSKGTDWQYDVNSLFIFKDALWLGVSYRNQKSVNALIQAQLTNQLTIGYSYDYPIGEYTRLGGPSHEFKIGYRFELFKSNYLMPRYF